MEHCPTAEQIADVWTKQLGPGSFVVYRGRFMGVIPFVRSQFGIVFNDILSLTH
jgi:hypothetical protein